MFVPKWTKPTIGLKVNLKWFKIKTNHLPIMIFFCLGQIWTKQPLGLKFPYLFKRFVHI